MNRAESERLEARFASNGFPPATCAEEADVIVVNSCVVRQHAEDKVVNKLYNLKALKHNRPGLRIALTGCFVGQEADELKKRFPYVDYFFRPGDIPDWLQKEHCSPVPLQSTAVTAFVPIIQGCNNFCAYCIVPYRRGRERSRPVAEISREVQELVRGGAREVTLLGQNVDSYGHDLPGRPDLADLLTGLNAIEGLSRLRFLTNHPKDMSTRLIETVARRDKVCEQISLPVQSGNNDILKLMRRDYTVEHYRRLVAEIRRLIPGIALSTDVIVGFPSESEAQFQQTFDLLSELRFDTVHVAAYSPRPGTLAARELEDDIPLTEKKRRLNMIEQLQEGIATEINARLLGQTVEVLVEARKKGKWQGRTRSDKLVFFSDRDSYAGQLVNIRIGQTSPWSLQGKVESGKNHGNKEEQ